MTDSANRGQIILDYHERTKHHLHRFARSAGHMDWANQPNPFRTYAGAKTLPLPLTAADPALAYDALYRPATEPPASFTRAAIGTLLELSLGLSAWKAVPGQRWSLRINPSSGNLHPTEAHLLSIGCEDVPDGIYHYHPLEHTLEERARLLPDQARALVPRPATPGLIVTLSTIYWRESWKYGERAFRYCQHDIGHALAALRLAARLLNWRLVRLEAADRDIATAFGFDRTPWPQEEAEEPALIAAVLPVRDSPPPQIFPTETADILSAVAFTGHPNQLSPRQRNWDIIARASTACRQPRHSAPVPPWEIPPATDPPEPSRSKAAAIIRQRRSAQAFDPGGRLSREAFMGLLDRTLPRQTCPPFDALAGPPRISLILFIHRVQDVPPGLYAFIRHPSHFESLREAMSASFAWETVSPGGPLYLLQPGDLRAEAIDLSCRQEIGGFSTFSLGMLAQFEPEIRHTPWVYRHLFWEAGMIGQVLYLDAEARGARGTGIGCYFDDAVHEHLGLNDRRWQSLYHFTIGYPVEDQRLQTLPPYFHLDPDRKRSSG